MERAQFYACPLCSFLEAKRATRCCRFVLSKYSDLKRSQANFTDAIPLCCDLKNNLLKHKQFLLHYDDMLQAEKTAITPTLQKLLNTRYRM
jgi:hypothetical protein